MKKSPIISEQKFAALTVKLWRLHQRFDEECAVNVREQLTEEIQTVLQELHPLRQREMDILITSTGRIFRRMDNCTALALIEALPSVFEMVKPAAPPAPVTTPRFYVAGSPHTGAIGVYVQLPTGEVRSVFTESITKIRAEDALGAGEIPDSVWEHFESKRSIEMQRWASGTLRR